MSIYCVISDIGYSSVFFFFFQAEDGIRDVAVTGVQTCALPISLFEWSAQSKVDPLPVAKAKGVYFWTPEGKRFLDFNSQLMSVNIGHGDPRVIEDRKSTRLNSSHGYISYAVFCLKKKK